MFVRWIDENRIDSLYECDAVSVENLKADEGPDCIVVRLQRDGVEVITLIMSKSNCNELYVMNNNGKTIDSNRWGCDETDSVTVEWQESEGELPAYVMTSEGSR